MTAIATQAELTQALSTATGGDTLHLAPGGYALGLFRRAFDAPLTITSADPSSPARITGFDLRDAGGIVFDRVHLDYTAAAATPTWAMPFRVTGGRNLTFRRCLFDGDLAQGLTAAENGFAAGRGLQVQGCAGVTVEDCETRYWHTGMMFGGCTDLTLRRNNVHSMRSDGVNVAGCQRVTVEGNWFHDFRASRLSADHGDFLQFWTTGTKAPTTDVVIRGNLLDVGAGRWTQSIFMRNEEVDTGRAGEAMFYRNILIEGNVIANAHLHGITVGETDGLTIRSNTLMRVSSAMEPTAQQGVNSAVWKPMINIARRSKNVTVADNIAAAITGEANRTFTPPPDWSFSGNRLALIEMPSRRVGPLVT